MDNFIKLNKFIFQLSIRILYLILDIDFENKDIINIVLSKLKSNIDIFVPIVLAICSSLIDKNIKNFGPTIIASSLCFAYSISTSKKQLDNKLDCLVETEVKESKKGKSMNHVISNILDKNYLFIGFVSILFIFNCLAMNEYWFEMTEINQIITAISGMFCYIMVIAIYHIFIGIIEQEALYISEEKNKRCPLKKGGK